MKINAKTKRILKILTLSAFALLEAYLIYAAVASMHTYHQHPRFVSADGEVAQSSGYRSQFYVCIVFAIIIPLLAGFASYMFYIRKPKKSAQTLAAVPSPENAVAATADGTTDAATETDTEFSETRLQSSETDVEVQAAGR